MGYAISYGLTGIPHIAAGADLGAEILAAMAREQLSFEDGDIVVVAQKIVSKAEGRLLDLRSLTPSPRALELAAATGKDARLVEAVLQESTAVLRWRTNVLVVEHRLGHVMANAGIDRSNVEADPDDNDVVLLLPEDPDLSAGRLRRRLEAAIGRRIGVIISDSFGRPWRIGTTGVAIGIAGPAAVVDRRGEPDLYGRKLQVTEVAFADAVAAAAVLVMGEGDEARPVVVMRGYKWQDSQQVMRDGLRKREGDLFR